MPFSWSTTVGMRPSSLRTAELTTRALPELRDFPQAEYLEISWGDAEYFPAPDAGVFGALKAAFWSSGSVIHMVGFSGSIEKPIRAPKLSKFPLPMTALTKCFAISVTIFCGPIQRNQPKPRRVCFPTAGFTPPGANSAR